MKATLTDLQRRTKEVVRPVIHAGQTVTLTDHGEPCAKISPIGNRPLTMSALKLLASIPATDRLRNPVDEVET